MNNEKFRDEILKILVLARYEAKIDIEMGIPRNTKDVDSLRQEAFDYFRDEWLPAVPPPSPYWRCIEIERTMFRAKIKRDYYLILKVVEEEIERRFTQEREMPDPEEEKEI
jgi:hypothetical protein